jgi:ABC-type branched-subunit amino acid transport system substrate-binding protein
VRQSAIVIPTKALRRILVMLIVVIALIAVLFVVRAQSFRAGVTNLFAPSGADLVDTSAYQAVFLTNGSTYFGKLQPQGENWFLLSDVFYLSSTEQGGAQLIKRGSESQGPKEPMIIPTAQILFIENLRDDGDVVVAIKRFKSGQLPAASPAPATTAPATQRPSASPTPTR